MMNEIVRFEVAVYQIDQARIAGQDLLRFEKLCEHAKKNNDLQS
jgi:hypothetical protein